MVSIRYPTNRATSKLLKSLLKSVTRVSMVTPNLTDHYIKVTTLAYGDVILKFRLKRNQDKWYNRFVTVVLLKR